LVYIGFHADRPTVSDITEEHLEDIMPSIMNINTSNMEAYNVYIDANPDSFGSPATASEVQAMVDSVNAQVLSANTEEAPNTSDNNTTTSESNTTAEESSEENLSNVEDFTPESDENGQDTTASSDILIQIGIRSDNNESNFTIEQLETIEPALNDINSSYIKAYNDYLNTNPDNFSSPATVNEVQAMIDLVNEAEKTKLLDQTSGSSEETTTPLEDEPEVVSPSTIVNFAEGIEVSQNAEDGLKIESVSINERDIEVKITSTGEINGSVSFQDNEGNSLKSLFEIENAQNSIKVDTEGKIETTVALDNGANVIISINEDGTVGHEMTMQEGLSTKVLSRIAGADIKVDTQGNITISSEVEKDGFIYKVVVTTNSLGESHTKFVKIDVVTNEETALSNTLKEGESFESGNEVSVLELDGVIYIEVKTLLTTSLTIE